MKNLKTTIGILAIAFASLTVVISCKEGKKGKATTNEHKGMMKDNHSKMEHNDKEGHHDKKKSKTARNIKANTNKNAAITPILNAYFLIKEGLVADSKENAAKGGTALLAAFSKFDMSSLSGDTHKQYMDILESAKEQAEHIVKSPIHHQREHFETLSTDIIDLVTLLGTEKTIYQDYCPMAKASWLSENKAIKNPYYGAKMLKCGWVKKQIN